MKIETACFIGAGKYDSLMHVLRQLTLIKLVLNSGYYAEHFVLSYVAHQHN